MARMPPSEFHEAPKPPKFVLTLSAFPTQACGQGSERAHIKILVMRPRRTWWSHILTVQSAEAERKILGWKGFHRTVYTAIEWPSYVSKYWPLNACGALGTKVRTLLREPLMIGKATKAEGNQQRSRLRPRHIQDTTAQAQCTCAKYLLNIKV